MKKSLYALLTLAVALCLLLTGCSQSAAPDRAQGGANEKYYDEYVDSEGITEDSSLKVENASQRKVIITADYTVETSDLAASVETLKQLVQQSGGYIETSRVSGESAENGSGYFVLRIPADQMNTLDAGMAQVGTVNESSKTEDDITNEYYDVDARRQAKEAQRDRILALLEKAETLEDLLRLESELAQVQAELESLTGQQNRYDQLVTYATVTVDLWQSTLTQSGNTPFGPQLWRELQDSFSTAVELLKGLAVAIVWLLPYALVAGIVLIVVLVATRKKRKARREMRRQMRQFVPPAGQPPVPPTSQNQ